MPQNPFLKEHIANDFHISHSISTTWGMKDFHFHDVFEIYYALCDGIKYFVNDKVYALETGDLLIFNSQDLHRSMPVPDLPYERYIVTFIPEYLPDFSPSRTDLLECFFNRGADFRHKRHLSEKQSEELLALFRKAEAYCSSMAYGADIYKKIILSEILLLVNSFYRDGDSLPSGKTEGDYYTRVKPIIQYIHQNLSEPLTLEDIAGNFYLSRYHLGYLFKKATGFSVNEYIVNRRIMKAKEYLKKNLPVSQACECVGFHNLSHFTRTFKRLTGLSPKQYARRG